MSKLEEGVFEFLLSADSIISNNSTQFLLFFLLFLLCQYLVQAPSSPLPKILFDLSFSLSFDFFI